MNGYNLFLRGPLPSKQRRRIRLGSNEVPLAPGGPRPSFGGRTAAGASVASACAAAGVWDVITEGQKNQPAPAAASAAGSDDDEEYDL